MRDGPEIIFNCVSGALVLTVGEVVAQAWGQRR